MKIAIIYYSFSGNTKKACEFLADKLLESKIEAKLIELKLKVEEKSFLGRCKAARDKYAPELLTSDFDLKAVDFVVFASPVWAFSFAPALRSYIQKCAGVENKKTAIFLTCGSAITSGRALSELRDSAVFKGANVVFNVYIKGSDVEDRKYLEKSFERLIALV